MSNERTQRTALVTGGSRGIGLAVAEALLGEGWKVYLCSRRPESVEKALGELGGRFGDRVAGRAVDVRSQEQVDEFVSWVEGEAGGIDCLVNNAGLGHFGPIDRITGDQWREVIEVNLSGAFYFLRAAAPGMRRRSSGWVINVASLAAKNPFAGGAAYNASKFGMLGMSEAAMLDLRHDGIRVATIMPGSVDTDFHDRDASWMLAPEDVARTVLDLLAYPERALASRIELRPTRPPKKS